MAKYLSEEQTQIMLDLLKEYVDEGDEILYKLLKKGGGGTGGGSESIFEQKTGTTVTVGGLPSGSIITNKTAVEVLSDILFPYIYSAPSISIGLSCKTLYDKDIDTLSSVTITANVTKGSEEIKYVKFYVNGTVVQTLTTAVKDGGVFKFTYTPAAAINSTTTFKVECCDTPKGTGKTTQSMVTFVQKSDWGPVPSVMSPTDIAVITTLNSGLKTSVAMTQKFTSEYGRFVFAYPTAIGSVKSIKDNVNNFNYTDSCSRGNATINGGSYEIIYLTECAGFEDVSITFA